MSGVRDLVVVDFDVDPGVVHVIGPFSANPIIKDLDADLRRWDSTAHAWVVEAEAVPGLIAALLADGFPVDIWRPGDELTMLSPRDRKAA